ncbi:transmembrane amino acid transporter protein-domain-containing protein [Phakopsora pachyrhizi]|uniref:Transmembrane amino acid transporter protein-domain-containing protein n=1 Tax=Phakopsora pachyrhizi TaxID=170000 RepID=A0AAV0ATH1_PHAPC|nr:transmembrane amino acid transporter protein-domain-containing protein [Phakopsora pachyrhizi]CAH7672267.1 transmembrane amino acid transporter protein-domain-containing protein [Phakopsora pachyrhizi]
MAITSESHSSWDGLNKQLQSKHSSPSSSSLGNSNNYPPPPRLASTISSREFAFEADSDTVSVSSTLNNRPNQLQQLPMTRDLQVDGSIRKTALLRSEDHLADARYRFSMDQDISEDNYGTDENISRTYHDDNQLSLTDRGSNLVSGIANMSNSILGAGIIGLPYSLRSAGLVTGVGMIIILGYITDWSIRILALNCKLTGRKTYIGIMEHCFGSIGMASVSFFQFIFAFGGMCAFGVIIGDSIPPVLMSLLPSVISSSSFSFLLSRSFIISFFTLTVSYPLSLHRDISKLSKASGLALVSMVVIVLSVGVGGPMVDPKMRGDDRLRFSFIEPGFFEAVGIISFAFVCHHNSLLIFDSLKKPSLDRFDRLIHFSTLISIVASLSMSLSGFLTFTNKTQANVLNNFPKDDFWINVSRLCFGLNMFTTLPLECFVCRETIETCFYGEKQFDRKRHIIYTTLLIGSVLIISLSTCDLGIVLELTGGFAAPALAFIFPAACQLKLALSSSTNLKNSDKRKKNLSLVVLIGFGLVVMVISTTGSLVKAFDPNHRAQKVCH